MWDPDCSYNWNDDAAKDNSPSSYANGIQAGTYIAICQTQGHPASSYCAYPSGACTNVKPIATVQLNLDADFILPQDVLEYDTDVNLAPFGANDFVSASYDESLASILAANALSATPAGRKLKVSSNEMAPTPEIRRLTDCAVNDDCTGATFTCVDAVCIDCSNTGYTLNANGNCSCDVGYSGTAVYSLSSTSWTGCMQDAVTTQPPTSKNSNCYFSKS
jgi:hypothetical protein